MAHLFSSMGMSVPVRSHLTLTNELIAFLLYAAVSEYLSLHRENFVSEWCSAFELEVISQSTMIFWA